MGRTAVALVAPSERTPTRQPAEPRRLPVRDRDETLDLDRDPGRLDPVLLANARSLPRTEGRVLPTDDLEEAIPELPDLATALVERQLRRSRVEERDGDHDLHPNVTQNAPTPRMITTTAGIGAAAKNGAVASRNKERKRKIAIDRPRVA